MKTNNIITKTLLMIVALTSVFYSCGDGECKYEGGTEDTTFPYSCEAGMDVAFLIDYTGSMGGAIADIQGSVTAIANTIETESGGDYRLSLSIFDEMRRDMQPTYFTQADYTGLPAAQKIVINTGTGTPGTDQYLTVMEKFAPANKAIFSSQLAKLNASMALGNGVGYAEPGGLLLNEVLNNNFAGAWRTGSITKIAIIITDAPAGGDDDTNDATDDAYLANLATQANAMGVQCILVTSMAAGTSNYEIQLIDNNTEGVKLTDANFGDVSTDIIQLIEDICVANEG